MCFSSTITVLPTTLNNAQAVSRWLASANLPLHMPVMPQPSTQGVFGMARTTGTSPPSAFSIWLVGTDAATEMRSEERRVGKEGRSRWETSDEKKKK